MEGGLEGEGKIWEEWKVMEGEVGRRRSEERYSMGGVFRGSPRLHRTDSEFVPRKRAGAGMGGVIFEWKWVKSILKRLVFWVGQSWFWR